MEIPHSCFAIIIIIIITKPTKSVCTWTLRIDGGCDLMQTSRIWWAGLFYNATRLGTSVQRLRGDAPVTRVVRMLDKVAAVAARCDCARHSKTVHAIGDAFRQQRQRRYTVVSPCTVHRYRSVTVPVQSSCDATCRQVYCYTLVCTRGCRVRSRSNNGSTGPVGESYQL
jgi:hypothetical protein